LIAIISEDVGKLCAAARRCSSIARCGARVVRSVASRVDHAGLVVPNCSASKSALSNAMTRSVPPARACCGRAEDAVPPCGIDVEDLWHRQRRGVGK